MAVAQDKNNNIFLIVFALVEGETAGGCIFFLKNIRLHVSPSNYHAIENIQINIHQLRVLINTLITVGKILFLHMFIALTHRSKFLSGDQRQDVTEEGCERLVCINITFLQTLPQGDHIDKCRCSKVNR